jgi:archaellum component FlaC
MEPDQSNQKEIEENLDARASEQKLFENKVAIMGELHTRRALLANRLGRVKSEAMMLAGKESPHEVSEDLPSLEEELSAISHEITEFSPDSQTSLEEFQARITRRFDEAEERIQKAEATLGEGLA